MLGAGSPIAFAPDGSAEGALLDRLAQAAQTESPLASEVANHTRATITAYAAKPTVASYYGPPYQGSLRAELGQRSPGPRSYYFDLFNFERVVLQPLIDEADALLAELAFT